MIRLSLCGLGKAAPAPVLGFLQFFRAEFEAHLHGVCSTGTCDMRAGAALAKNGHAAGSPIPLVRVPATTPTREFFAPPIQVIEFEPQPVSEETSETIQPMVASVSVVVMEQAVEPDSDEVDRASTIATQELDVADAPIIDGTAMLAEFYGIVVRMRYTDHQPPHLRAAYSEQECTVGLDPVRVWSGGLPGRAQSMLLEWVVEHKAELDENWLRGRDGHPLHDVTPLE